MRPPNSSLRHRSRTMRRGVDRCRSRRGARCGVSDRSGRRRSHARTRRSCGRLLAVAPQCADDRHRTGTWIASTISPVAQRAIQRADERNPRLRYRARTGRLAQRQSPRPAPTARMTQSAAGSAWLSDAADRAAVADRAISDVAQRHRACAPRVTSGMRPSSMSAWVTQAPKHELVVAPLSLLRARR